MTTTMEEAVKAANNITDASLRTKVLNSLREDASWVNCVSAFHSLYECPDDTDIGTSENVSHMSDERLSLRIELIDEEFKELRVATQKRDEVEMGDALGDIVYVVTGFALEMGIDLQAVVREIQASNMTKLGQDGNVIRREDGKILKGPNYRRPDIKPVLRYRK